MSLIEEINKLKEKNQQLKTLLSLGGESRVSSENFRKLVDSDDDRRKFIKRSIIFLRRNNFDGLDLGK
jgi:GH18 family chitinase